MNYQIITQSKQLETVCLQARDTDIVMLDTEFVRTRTYYPQLGLIQLFDGEHLSLIDPTVIEDMSAFEQLLKDTSVLKVLHAC
ncbi:ribonuclease D, partial [Vibrio xuii]